MNTVSQDYPVLTSAELDTVSGGDEIKVFLKEVPCPIGHLTVVVVTDNGQQAAVGVRYHG